ncbi:MAG: ATP-binding protein [Lachnospiraceae bacterium]|nr:ATP-binding protein [Lachnospiraceae bacterium]
MYAHYAMLCEMCDREELKIMEGILESQYQQYHGYGIKSIWHTVKKYGGAVNLAVKDHWFELKILIPMQEKES